MPREQLSAHDGAGLSSQHKKPNSSRASVLLRGRREFRAHSFALTFMAMLAQYWGRPRAWGTPMEALRATKHWEGTPRKESLALFTSLYSSAPAGKVWQ